MRLTVAYDGAPYRGFSPQAGLPTVGGSLASALRTVFRLPTDPPLTCAGRTDAGVHARGQVVHVDLPAGSVDAIADVGSLPARFAKLLGPTIVVRSVSVVPDSFDARHSALWRRYRYTVLNSPVADPFLHGRVWHVPERLDVRAMQLACDAVVGTHDFASFCRKPPAGGSTTRNVLSAGWSVVSGADELLVFEVVANAFCQQMVRSLVGTLVEVGRGKRRAGEMSRVLRARDRAQAGAVAPPDGLCLWEVSYP